MNKVLCVVLLAFVFASCQNSAESEVSEVATSDSIATVASAAPIAAGAGDPAALNTPAVASATPVAAPAPSAMPSSTGNAQVAGGLNPAHGAPGHRCDIAVGAPLDSKPVSQTMTQTTATSPQYKPTFNLVKSATDSTKQ